ncbi:D-isomer specific 2-hydroxyacid dehydrogenase NAD-binding protein [Oceanithermus profundus DSM 14977]|uniref:D-isomer specific 2-hydroxyacid dehydrogenase NAD-binding protein n=1 Tax=Oceanithermus profundus (strain DSM 14977 / NBRC 100410 / VKM B-2274 / 506) TaxID=670487 RepID=E4U4Q0_OCEP5|nr:2-hydroxyacid dehydrogenase [Oceanithermus profundus]ADR37117.1 D-isomer specific 2-hydroxyacid dehydrogenase NAD-binding protein [Oceanithermus profundus DSM 14977]
MRLAVADDVRPDYLSGLPGGVEVVRFPLEGAPGPEVLAAEFVVPTRRPMAEALERMPNLRVVQTISAGVDWVLPFVPEGVTLADARGVHDVAVSEWVLTALLVATKRVPELVERQGAAAWDGGFRPGELWGQTVLILGYGSIGRAVEARLAPFGVRVLRLARRPRAGVRTLEAMPELLPHADAVVLLLPLTPATRGLVDAAFLERMKPGALLVNAGRGALVDTGALLEALRAGRVRAALDVTDPEPLPQDHPLWRAPGVWITPHLAGSSPRLRARGFALVRAQVARYLRGAPLFNVVREGY